MWILKTFALIWSFIRNSFFKEKIFGIAVRNMLIRVHYLWSTCSKKSYVLNLSFHIFVTWFNSSDIERLHEIFFFTISLKSVCSTFMVFFRRVYESVGLRCNICWRKLSADVGRTECSIRESRKLNHSRRAEKFQSNVESELGRSNCDSSSYLVSLSGGTVQLCSPAARPPPRRWCVPAALLTQ